MLVRWLPRGIPERLEQPGWTRRCGRAVVLVPIGALSVAVVAEFATTTLELALGLVLVAVLLPAAVIDIAWRVVPDSLSLVGAALAFGLIGLLAPSALVTHALAGLIGGVVMLALAFLARGGIGLGDVKLVAMLGVVLGAALPVAVIAAALISGLAALPVRHRRGRGATVPLVPFLAAGALVASVGVTVPGWGL